MEGYSRTQPEIGVDLGSLRDAIIEEYKAVAQDPQQGFHFHTGRRLTQLVGYADELLEGIPESSIAAFAGTGNPFSLGPINPSCNRASGCPDLLNNLMNTNPNNKKS